SLSSTREALTRREEDSFADNHPVVAKFIWDSSEKLDSLIREVESVKEQQVSESSLGDERWDYTEASRRDQEWDRAYQRVLDMLIAIIIAFLPQVISLPPAEAQAEVKLSPSATSDETISSPPEDLDLWILETLQRLRQEARYGQEVRAL